LKSHAESTPPRSGQNIRLVDNLSQKLQSTIVIKAYGKIIGHTARRGLKQGDQVPGDMERRKKRRSATEKNLGNYTKTDLERGRTNKTSPINLTEKRRGEGKQRLVKSGGLSRQNRQGGSPSSTSIVPKLNQVIGWTTSAIRYSFKE